LRGVQICSDSALAPVSQHASPCLQSEASSQRYALPAGTGSAGTQRGAPGPKEQASLPAAQRVVPHAIVRTVEPGGSGRGSTGAASGSATGWLAELPPELGAAGATPGAALAGAARTDVLGSGGGVLVRKSRPVQPRGSPSAVSRAIASIRRTNPDMLAS
jgi:hypothetical protein